jgi:hypothetical protein
MSWSKETIAWFQNKTKGGLAEAACKAHFQVLGFTVESTGIEHIAPGYVALSRDDGFGHHIRNYRQKLQCMPDFLASRVYADTQVNREKGSVGNNPAQVLRSTCQEAKIRSSE